MAIIKCFPPLVGKDPKILILGTMPGKASLDAHQYYGYKHNHFWKLIYTIFNPDFAIAKSARWAATSASGGTNPALAGPFGGALHKFCNSVAKFGFNLPVETVYARKTALLKDKHIALWDVLRQCSRPGSSADSAIRGEKPNDIPAFIRRHPSIERIYFNGRQAEKYFNKYFGDSIKLTRKALPSSSPANASLSFARKLGEWSDILNVNTERS